MTLDVRGNRRFGIGGRGRGKGCDGQRQSIAPTGRTTKNKHLGLEAAMKDNVFTYNKKGGADTMQNTLNILVKHIGTLYGQDIANEIGNRTVVTITKPKHSRALLLAHAVKETLRTENYNRLNFHQAGSRESATTVRCQQSIDRHETSRARKLYGPSGSSTFLTDGDQTLR